MPVRTVTRKFYHDPGHGWLAVKVDELKELGITKKISVYSYQKGCTVYLEEDADMMEYIRAQQRKGVEVNVTEIRHKIRSSIRSYAQYKRPE